MTDEQLRSAKELVNTNCYIPPELARALIARLEAAEAVCNYWVQSDDEWGSDKDGAGKRSEALFESAQKALAAWRSLKTTVGKEGT